MRPRDNEETIMAVAAVKPYEFEPADAVGNFHGAQLLYIGWEDHLLFCAPFCLPIVCAPYGPRKRSSCKAAV